MPMGGIGGAAMNGAAMRGAAMGRPMVSAFAAQPRGMAPPLMAVSPPYIASRPASFAFPPPAAAAAAAAPLSSAVGLDLILDDPAFFNSMESATPPGYNPLAAPLAPVSASVSVHSAASPGAVQQLQLQQQLQSMYPAAPGAPQSAGAVAPPPPANPKDPWNSSLVNF